MIKRALISVWDKTDIIELSSFLIEKNIEIFSTGGTMKILIDANISIILFLLSTLVGLCNVRRANSSLLSFKF